jgi:hypothetical protein
MNRTTESLEAGRRGVTEKSSDIHESFSRLSNSIASSNIFRMTAIAATNTVLLARSLLPRTSVTFKLIISFWQVMTSGFFSLQISWPNNMKYLFNSLLSVNPFDIIFQSSSCSNHGIPTSYLVVVLIFCLPLIFVGCLLLSIALLYYYKIERYHSHLCQNEETNQKGYGEKWLQHCRKVIWATATTIFVWFLLIIFAIGSAT